jgi:hypothetical protein
VTRGRALASLLALLVLAGACTDDDPAADADAPVEVADVLVASADDVIVPSFIEGMDGDS